MAFGNFDENSLSQKLNILLSPSDPIRSPEHLRGRERNLSEIRRNLAVKGRHIFIYGDRGVGKTSLGQTAAIEFHPSTTHPVRVACSSGEGFASVIATIAKRVYAEFKINKSEVSVNIKLPFISASLKTSIESGEQPIISNLNDAVDALSYVAACNGNTPAIVVDEFDRLEKIEDKTKFAELVKQLSDQEVDVKLIFCGIGDSMHDLLGAHYSAGRAITPIHLERLDAGSLWQVIESSAKGLNLEIDHETVLRIGLLSDGFPYFVHLVCEQMFWAAFEDPEIVTRISPQHFGAGVDKAVLHAMSLLEEAYDKATKKYSDDYEEVLWALVDRPTLSRQSSSVYSESYKPLMSRRPERKLLTDRQFLARLNNLKGDRHGEIIRGTGAGWYQFRENMIRGYVKIRARSQGLELGIDHHNANSKSRDRIG